MAEVEVVSTDKKRGRPRKEVVEAVKDVVVDGGDTVKTTFEKAKDAVVNAVKLDSTTVDGLKKLGYGVAVAAADAAVIHLKDNLVTVNFGQFNSLVQTLSAVLLGELRNVLHGGSISSATVLEAVNTVLSEPEEKKE